MPRAYSLPSSRFPLFPPVKTCLRTGFLDITGRDQRGLSFFPSFLGWLALMLYPCGERAIRNGQRITVAASRG